MPVKAIPEGYRSITPYLAVDDATAAIEFYKRAFGAKERVLMPTPDGKVAHAELEIGDSLVMLSDPFGEGQTKAPKALGATTIGIFLYTEDVEETYKQAIDAGATSTQEPEDMFWGDRFARVTDPYGHSWQIATHVEDVAPEEMERRSQEAMASMSS
ncbi:MAG: VOC family protein [Actinobacteria bacterium]|nr:VOC family protein [Actinomycetota bacterium]